MGKGAKMLRGFVALYFLPLAYMAPMYIRPNVWFIAPPPKLGIDPTEGLGDSLVVYSGICMEVVNQLIGQW